MTYTELPDTSRVWVYTASRQLAEDEQANIQRHLDEFVVKWTAHRQALKAVAEIRNGRFLILAVDESQAGASGCSIDASVHFLQGLGNHFQIDFFDRMTFFADNGEGFLPYSQQEFTAAYESGELTDDSPVVDPLVNSKAQLEASFVKPLKDSWHKRFV